MPDVISNVQTMNLNRVDDFMEEENGSINGEDPMMSHHIISNTNNNNNNNMNQHPNNLLNLDRLDPMFSASNHHSTVDMSTIDPILNMNNYGLMSMHQTNCDNRSVDSILPSDTDSLISDIDMVA